MVVQGGVAVPNSVVFPHLLYDRSYRCLMTVKTDANTTGLFGAATLTTSEATWNVPKDERKSYVAAVRDGRDGHVSLWWQPAADTYYVYRTNGNGSRTLLTGEPLSQPGVNLDEEALFAAGVDPLDLFEIDGLAPGGQTTLGGTPNPGVIPPPGGGGGGPGPINDCEITCTPSGCTITGPKHCHLPGRTSVSIVYFSTDHLGTPRAVSDSNGNLLSQHDYEPFGLEIPAYTASNHTHRFTGHERDASVDLDYMVTRYFASSSARFLSPDGLQSRAPVMPSDYNSFVYVTSNPLRYADPEGEARKDEVKKLNKDDIKKRLADAKKALAKPEKKGPQAAAGAAKGSDTKAGTNKPGSPAPSPAVNPVELLNKALESAGDFTTTGADIAGALEESGVQLPDQAKEALKNLTSVTRKGDRVTATLASDVTQTDASGDSTTISSPFVMDLKGTGNSLTIQPRKGLAVTADGHTLKNAEPKIVITSTTNTTMRVIVKHPAALLQKGKFFQSSVVSDQTFTIPEVR